MFSQTTSTALCSAFRYHVINSLTLESLIGIEYIRTCSRVFNELSCTLDNLLVLVASHAVEFPGEDRDNLYLIFYELFPRVFALLA